MRLFCILFFLTQFWQLFGQVDTTFDQLHGIDDLQGNTHLYYRKVYGVTDTSYYFRSRDIYHMDLAHNSDTLFLREFIEDLNPWWTNGISVDDYEFWKNNPVQYIFGGAVTNSIESNPYISRFDSQFVFTGLIGVANNIEISHQNDSLIYASLFEQLITSTDGGFSWTYDTVNTGLVQLLGVSPFNDQILFAFSNNYLGGGLWKSIDAGNSYYQVDSSTVRLFQTRKDQFLFDPDSQHVYYISYNPSQMRHYLKTSADAGESWTSSYWDTLNIFQTLNYGQSGEIYLATGNRIQVSYDHGNTFSEFVILDRPVNGMYKKPGTQILFASTSKDIFRISPSAIISIKNLPVSIKYAEGLLDDGFVLFQNFPNPFNTSTIIKYYLSTASAIKINIYNLVGEKVRSFRTDRQPAGEYQIRWNSRDEYGRVVASGIYFYQLVVSGKKNISLTGKMMFLK